MTNKVDGIRALDGTLLLIFRELLRTGRARDVAEALDLSPSAVSYALARLRLLFKDELFIRRSHGFEPTARAMELRPLLDNLISLAASLFAPEVAFDPADSQRCFRFAAPEFVAAVIAAPLIEGLRANGPAISMQVWPMPEAQALAAIRDETLDFALGRFERIEPPLRREDLYVDESCVIARADHPDVDAALNLRAWSLLDCMFSGPRPPSHRQIGPDGAPSVVTPLVVAATDHIATYPQRSAERLAALLPIRIVPAPRSARIAISVARPGPSDAGLDWFLGQVRSALRSGQAG
jgi:DNA-binding transcriptional LysR family regulator